MAVRWGGECNMFRSDGKCIKKFSFKFSGKETIWN
jgi:hypothetical protein